MKFSCSRDELLKALNIVKRGVKDKTTMSILEGVLFKAGKNALTLTATDLNIGITTEIPIDCQEEGAIVLNANLITNITSKLSGDVVYFTTDGKNRVKIESLSTEFFIAGFPAQEFPEFPKPDSDLVFTIKSDELRELINTTRFAAATNENHMPVITGIKIECINDVMKMVTIDGFRLAIRNGNMDSSVLKEETAIVPGKSMGELSSLLSQLSGTVTINLSPTQIFFTIGNTVLTSRLIEGQFFEYQNIMPTEVNTSFDINRQDLLNSCERAALITSVNNNNLIRLDISSGKLEMSSKNDTGNFIDTVDIENVGDDLTIAFDTRFFIDALKAISDDEIKINFSSSVGPAHIRPLEGDQYSYLILPVRVSNN